MITFQKAHEIAKEKKKNINRCTEYEKGFLFWSTEDKSFFGGYGHGSIAINKETGDVLIESVFYYSNPGKELKTFSIE